MEIFLALVLQPVLKLPTSKILTFIEHVEFTGDDVE